MRRVKRDSKTKDDLFLRLTAVQLAAAAAIFLLLFLLVRQDGALALRVRSEFVSMMSGDWDLAGWFREESRFTVSGEDSGDRIVVPAFDDRTEPASSNGTAVILTAASGAKNGPSASFLTDSFYGSDAPVMPVDGSVTSEFGNRIHPITGEESFHSGRDIAADEGTDILAVSDGVVVAVGVGELSGNYVKIDHGGGMTALYCHCSAVYAEEGAEVRKGDVIAAVGETGAATGPHLHFEIRQNGELVDPASFLDGAVHVR